MTDPNLNLHIGGLQKHPDWKILNINSELQPDFIGNAADLSQFADSSVDQIYASHVYEHLDYNGELQKALTEAHRVLKPGALLFISVPDLEVLCRLIHSSSTDVKKQFYVMRMIYGGHTDPFDYHLTGLTFAILGNLLILAGFGEVKRVESFDIFQDTSDLIYDGQRISLNVIAKK